MRMEEERMSKMKRYRSHQFNNVVKRVAVAAALLCLLVWPWKTGQVNAQVFIVTDEEYINSNRANLGSDVVPISPQGLSSDWYAPIGEGWLLLAVGGGAYVLWKKRNR